MRSALLAATLLLPVSCSTLSLQIGADIDKDRLAAFEVGQTRRAEVLASLGPPMVVAAHADGAAFLYQSVHLKERQLGLGLEKMGVPGLSLLKLSIGRSGSHQEAALLLFDADAVLTGLSHGSWDEVFGRAGSAQFVFIVQETVDSGTLRAGHPALGWGRELLDPLPLSLNRQHRADFELRGTGVGAGQRTLEMLGGEGG